MNVIESPALFPSGIGARPSAASAQGPAANADFQTFLTLLTAQLRNQDPMQPIDSTEFVAQLASFTSAEQLIAVNDRLDTIRAQGISAEIAALGSWVGKEVAATDGSFRAPGGPMVIGLPDGPESDRLSARVLDAAGTEVAGFEIDDPAAGTAVWNGRDSEGTFLRGADLRIVIDYKVGDTVIAQKPAAVYREVVGIRATANGVALDLADGGAIDTSRVGQLRDPRTQTAPIGS